MFSNLIPFGRLSTKRTIIIFVYPLLQTIFMKAVLSSFLVCHLVYFTTSFRSTLQLNNLGLLSLVKFFQAYGAASCFITLSGMIIFSWDDIVVFLSNMPSVLVWYLVVLDNIFSWINFYIDEIKVSQEKENTTNNS